MLIFRRGFFAEEWARKERGQPSGDLQLGGDKKVVDAFRSTSTFSANDGAVAVTFVGRFVGRAERVHVIVGRTGWLFPTAGADAVRLEAGWYPIRVPQSRIGVNAGAVQILPGYVTLLEYRPNWLGPPGGKFVDGEIDWSKAIALADFPACRDSGAF